MKNNTNPNDPAFCGPTKNGFANGLTKREYLAACADGNIDGWSMSTIEEIMEEKIPTGKVETLKYLIRVEAKLKTMRADALILELNK